MYGRKPFRMVCQYSALAAIQIADRVIGSSIRKLNLIYLANEVAQQSRAKKRTEYPEAFAKV